MKKRRKSLSRKREQIDERLEFIENRLGNANSYLSRNVNVEGTSFLHFGDWKGNSGHPLWMRNHMIPSTARHRDKLEKTLMQITDREKDKNIKSRKKDGVKSRQWSSL